MLTEELIELVKVIQSCRAEAQVTEVKAAYQGCPKRLYDTLSSFSNQDSGGTIVFGLEESLGFQAVGVYDLQDLQKHVTEQCNQMDPPVRAMFTFAEYQGVWILSAEIPAVELSDRPCYYKGAGRVKGSYVRVGDADLPMTDYEIYSYEAYRRHFHDDERSVERGGMKFMDVQKIEDYIREKKKERPQFSLLEKEQIYELLNITKDGNPTLASWMNFSIYPQSVFPQLCVTAIVVQGYEIGDVAEDDARFIDNKRINGTIPELVEETIAFCRRNMKTRTIIDPDTGKRRDKTEYPVNAIREAVLNAVIHRDYSVHTEGTPIQVNFFKDRLEIHSPGNLYGRMTVEELGVARPDIRNPLLAIITESLTEAENRYSGVPTMRREMKEYGLPAPVFENRRNEFVVILYNSMNHSGETHDSRSKYSADGAGRSSRGMVQETNAYAGGRLLPYAEDMTRRLLAFCREPRSREEIAEFVGIRTQFYVVSKYIKPLLEDGRLQMTIPDKPKSKNQRYYTCL